MCPIPHASVCDARATSVDHTEASKEHRQPKFRGCILCSGVRSSDSRISNPNFRDRTADQARELCNRKWLQDDPHDLATVGVLRGRPRRRIVRSGPSWVERPSNHSWPSKERRVADERRIALSSSSEGVLWREVDHRRGRVAGASLRWRLRITSKCLKNVSPENTQVRGRGVGERGELAAPVDRTGGGASTFDDGLDHDKAVRSADPRRIILSGAGVVGNPRREKRFSRKSVRSAQESTRNTPSWWAPPGTWTLARTVGRVTPASQTRHSPAILIDPRPLSGEDIRAQSVVDIGVGRTGHGPGFLRRAGDERFHPGHGGELASRLGNTSAQWDCSRSPFAPDPLVLGLSPRDLDRVVHFRDRKNGLAHGRSQLASLPPSPILL